MKNLNNSVILLTILFFMFLFGCSNDDASDPVSFLDRYTVNLTEEEGTTYSGDFFPIYEGHTCNYSGSVIMQTKLVIPGNDPIEEPTIAPTIGMLKVLAQRDIPLQSGTIPLFPIVDLSDMQGNITADTSRFFSKDDQAVYVKAMKMSDGSYLEIDDPVYIKSSLVVGESWNTAPKMDMTELLTSELSEDVEFSDLTLNAKSRFFVVGHEMITLPIGSRWAMRMEQANDIAMTGKLFIEGSNVSMKTTAKFSTVYHLIADTGIVHQNTTGPLKMTMTFEGQSISIIIDIEKSELSLTSLGDKFFKNTYYSNGTIINTSTDLGLFTSQVPQNLWKISQTIVYLLSKSVKL